MMIAMRCDLVAGSHGFADQMRKSLGEITDEKTCRGAATFRQKLKQRPEVLFHPAFELVPVGWRRFQSRPGEIEPVLDID